MRISSEGSSDLITPGTNPTSLGHSLTSFCTDKYLFTLLTSRGFSKTDLCLSASVSIHSFKCAKDPEPQLNPYQQDPCICTELHRALQRDKKPASINAGNVSIPSSNQATYPHSCRMHKGSWPSVQLQCLVFCWWVSLAMLKKQVIFFNILEDVDIVCLFQHLL